MAVTKTEFIVLHKAASNANPYEFLCSTNYTTDISAISGMSKEKKYSCPLGQ
jgi:hypothetical protein